MTIYFEDVEPGQVRDLGSFTVTSEEIVAFAERYDPQPFHVDEDAAADSIYGGLIASGWHTAALCMRQLVEHFFADTAGMGAIGLEELRWHQPVRPGDTVAVENEILETSPSDSREDRGYVTNRTVGTRDGEDVIAWVAVNVFARRDTG